ncbi:hypothetical protein T09_11514 [Trichinella sp. T9]|nr:hypothetical protein T09_11514 [Trichinella sp. T9]
MLNVSEKAGDCCTLERNVAFKQTANKNTIPPQRRFAFYEMKMLMNMCAYFFSALLMLVRLFQLDCGNGGKGLSENVGLGGDMRAMVNWTGGRLLDK